MNLKASPPPSAALASQSPPPGRPRLHSIREKRGRESSGSETEQSSSKVAKQSDVGKAATVTEKDPADDTSTPKDIPEIETKEPQVDMTGKVVEEESYCPASPDPREARDPGMITSVQGTPVKLQSQGKFLQSPIIARTIKKN